MRGYLLTSLLAGAGVLQQAESATLFAVNTDKISLFDNSTKTSDIASIFNSYPFIVQSTVTLGMNEVAEGESSNATNSTYLLFWQSFVDNVLIAEGTQDLETIRLFYETAGDIDAVSETIDMGEGVVYASGSHQIRVDLTLDGETSSESRDYMSYGRGASFVPLVIILLLAMTTHMVEFSLGFGIFVGACMVEGTVTGGFKTTLDNYILNAIANVDHAYVYLFTLFMAGFVGLLEKSGGIIGFTKMMNRFAKGSRSGQFCAFLTGLIIFFDDYANILVAGPCMKPVLDSVMASREKLAFLIDATSAPIASLIPVSSWVGFEVGLIQTEIDKLTEMLGEEPTVGTSGFAIFLQSIRYRYYPIYMLFLIPILIISQRDFGPMLIAERKVRVYGRTDGGDGAAEEIPDEFNKNRAEDDTPKRWVNLVVPVVFLIFYIFYLLIITGSDGTGNQDFLEIMASSDSYSALLWGTMAAALTTQGWYLLQFKMDGKPANPRLGSFIPGWFYVRAKRYCCKKRSEPKRYPTQLLTWREGMECFLNGMAHVFAALVVLTLAWAAGSIMTAVGLDRFFSILIVQSNLDYRWLPTISFVVSIFIAFATGSSWGCMTIMFPLLVIPTYVASNGDPNIVYATIAGVLSGSVAGDHASPISDTTVLSSMSSGCQLLEHVRTQAPYVFLVVTWSVLVGTIPIGYEAYPNGVNILLGFVMTVITALVFGRSVISPNGRFGPCTELLMKMGWCEDLHELKSDTIRAYEAAEPVKKENASVGPEGEEGEEHVKSVDFDDEDDDTSGNASTEKAPPPPPQDDDQTAPNSPSSVQLGSSDAGEGSATVSTGVPIA